MADPEFASCYLKLARAQEHFDTFKSELIAWQDTHPYTVQKTWTAHGSRHGVTVRVRNAPNVQRWSLIAADCAHNLRSALDHVVYGAAIRKISGTPHHPKRLQFPIFESRDKFDENLRWIDQLSSKAQAFIESAQPYNRRNPREPSALSVLKALDDSDKHRLLNVAFENIGSGEVKFRTPRVGGSDFLWRLLPIEDGAEIVSFTVTPPYADLQYDVKLALHITVNHVFVPGGSGVSPLAGVLKALIVEIQSIVDGVILAA